jgi:phage tail sheath protein FI
VNVIRQDPAGFLCLDSDTLSLDPDVQPINVRRLMMLLRKTALRFGTRYVFEPSSDAFRRSVQRGFESVLETMFLRGAFSGRTPSSAFQVVTDATLNTPQSVEQGRFIVDLKVAPSVPLTFLTVRLLQTADRASVTEGVGG